MHSFKFPTSAKAVLIGYAAITLTGLAFLVLGLQMHTSAAIISGTLLGLYVALYCPQVFAHIAAYQSKVYTSEWIFIAVTLLPVPFWLYAMFFLHVSDEHAASLALPAATFFLAYLLPSNPAPQERVPAWQTLPRKN